VSRVLMLSVVVVVGCGNRPDEVMQPPVPTFTADPVASGAALLTRATISGSDVDVTVVGRALGPVLGYAFTLRYEGLTPQADATVPEALGPNAYGEALYLKKPGTGTLAIGGARQGAAAGEKTISDETVLAELKLTLTGTDAKLSLTGTSVRRANGDAVVAAVAGGKIGVAR